MHWFMGATALIALAILLRQGLWTRARAGRKRADLSAMTGERESAYRPLAQEVEIRTAILAVSLDDAMNERQAGHDESAWRLLDLAMLEWMNLETLNGALHELMKRYSPAIESVIPLKRLGEQSFRAPEMSHYVRWHEVLDQFVFPSRLRFQMHLQVLRQAAEALVTDLRLTWQSSSDRGLMFDEAWNLCERDFHDYDLVMKETLVGFRAFLLGIVSKEIPAFAADLDALLRPSSRSAPPSLRSATPQRS